MRGVALDRLKARVFLRENWDDILEFSVAQGAQSAHGAFTITEAPDSSDWRRLEFSATTDFDLDVASRLIGPGAEKFVQPYRFAMPPRLVLAGTFEGETATGWTHQSVDLAVESAGAFSFEDFPVRDLVTHARIRDEVVELSGLTLHVANGQLAGQTRLWTAADGERRLAFDGALTGANLGEAIRVVAEFNARREGRPVPAVSEFQQRVATGKFDLTLKAEGPLDRPLALRGAGHADLIGADLGKIQLLGLLSDLLGHTLLNFTSLALDTARGDFTLDAGQITFPDLRLTGPSAALDARGDYRLDTEALDFKVRVYPLAENRTLVGNVIELFTNPLAKVLEVRLRGTAGKPDWTFVYGPTSLLRTITGVLEKPFTPTPPAVEKK